MTSNLWLKLLIWWLISIISTFICITNTIFLTFLKGARRHNDAVLLFFNTFHSHFFFFSKGSRFKFFAFSSDILTNPVMIGLVPIVLSVLDSPSDLERRGFVDPDLVTTITVDLINRRARAHIRRSQHPLSSLNSDGADHPVSDGTVETGPIVGRVCVLAGRSSRVQL